MDLGLCRLDEVNVPGEYFEDARFFLERLCDNFLELPVSRLLDS
jgi:hypothetical protein